MKKRYLVHAKIGYEKCVFSAANSLYALDLMTKMVESYDPERSEDKAYFSMEIIEDGDGEEPSETDDPF